MSNFLGTKNDFIAIYATINFIGSNNNLNIYTLVDYYKNILIYKTDEIIENADGNHYFLVEGKVKEHRDIKNQKQTILEECDFELVDRLDKITGDYYGCIGDKVELQDVLATYRRKEDIEWKITGEFSILTPESEYRMIIAKDNYTFILPYDSVKKLSYKKSERYIIYAKVVGYSVEKGKRATFLYPTVIQKRGELREGRRWWGGRWL